MELHSPNSTKFWHLLLAFCFLLTQNMSVDASNAFTALQQNTISNNNIDIGNGSTVVIPLQSFVNIHHLQIIDGQLYIDQVKLSPAAAQLTHNIQLLTAAQVATQNIPANYNGLKLTTEAVEEMSNSSTQDELDATVGKVVSTAEKDNTSLKDTEKKVSTVETLVEMQSPAHVSLIKSTTATIDNLTKSNHLLKTMGYKMAWATAGNLYVTLLNTHSTLRIVPSVVDNKAMLLVNTVANAAKEETVVLTLPDVKAEKTVSPIVTEEKSDFEPLPSKESSKETELVDTKSVETITNAEEKPELIGLSETFTKPEEKVLLLKNELVKETKELPKKAEVADTKSVETPTKEEEKPELLIGLSETFTKPEEKVLLLKNELVKETVVEADKISPTTTMTKVADTKVQKATTTSSVTSRVIELPPQQLFPNLSVSKINNTFLPTTVHRVIPISRLKGLSTQWMHQPLSIEEEIKIVDGVYYYDGLPETEYRANLKANRHESLPPEPMETVTLKMGENLKVGSGLTLTAPPPVKVAPKPKVPEVVYIDNIPYVNGWRISKAEADAVCAMSQNQRQNRYTINADTGDDAVASYRIVFRSGRKSYGSRKGIQKVALTDINKGGKPCHAHYDFNWNTKKAHPYKYKLSDMPDTVVVLLPKGVGTDFDMPIRGRVTSPFGPRWGRPHNGIDLDLDTGDAVKAAFKGRVRCSYYSKSYGNIIIIRHYNGLETYYAHLSRRNVRVNEYVEAGQVIGLGGSTGRSTGSHLHFEVRYKGHPINPAQVVNLSTFRLHGHTFILNGNNSSPSNPYSNKHYAGGSHWSVETASAGKGHYGHSHYRSGKKRKNSSSKKSKSYHKVRRGDSLSKIAQRYGTSMKRICSLNGISKRTTLKVGRRLRLK